VVNGHELDVRTLFDSRAFDIDFSADTRMQVLRRLGELAAGMHVDMCAADAAIALLERERLGSTVVCPGIALPHARLTGLNQPVLSVVRVLAGVDFEGEVVRLAIGIFVPDSDSKQHLYILRALARVLRLPGLPEELIGSSSGKEFMSTLQQPKVTDA
jgi:PTS system nitrogen regulatory IIA component